MASGHGGKLPAGEALELTVVAAVHAELAGEGVDTDRARRAGQCGSAERFIQTLLRDWAYAATYQNSTQRNHALSTWIDYYNHKRPDSALGHKAPASTITTD